MNRLPLIAGNWKMHNNTKQTKDFLDEFLPLAKDAKVELVICPPFTSLWIAAEKLAGTNVKLGAQNMHWEEKGAFTGEIAPEMLKEIPCDYVILGHSERRQYFAETDETVNKKIKTALKFGLTPIICVGESLEQREQGIAFEWVLGQVERALDGIEADNVKRLVFAYEPIWAIGTGKNASGEDAQEMIAAIRKKIEELYEKETADKVRILYGGSVKPENIKELMSKPDIDGALVGGASLDPKSFFAIATF